MAGNRLDARRLVTEFVEYYNAVRLHSAIAYITPMDKLAGRAGAIWAARKQKLATAAATRPAKAKRMDHPECCEIN
jgi:putative transposase